LNAIYGQAINMKPILTIMSGLPKAGKSTWIEKNKTSQDVIVSSDDIRKHILGRQFSPQDEPFIWTLVENLIILLMVQKKDIILDATNLHVYTRSKNIPLAQEHRYKTKLVWLNTDVKECLKRNDTSKNKKVPKEAMKRMCDVFQKVEPKYETDFDEIIEVRNGKNIKVK